MPATLIDADVRRVPIRFVSLADGQMRFFDADRKLTTESIDSFVGLRFDAPEAAAAATAAPRSILRLNDGHVLTGRFAGVDADGLLLWESASLGRIAVKLDDAAAFSVGDAVGPTPASSGAADDAVELTNGDRLAGFITAVDAQKLTLRVNEQPLPLAWDRIQRVTLANPVRRAPGVWLALVDGSMLRVDKLAADSESLKASVLGDRPLSLPLHQVRGLDFATRRRLVPLADAPMTITDGGVVFGVPTPPRLDGEAAQLHAPLAMKFELPDGAVRFAAAAALDPADLDWADLVLIVADGKGELARHRLNAEQPSVEINVALRDRSLTLKLDPGVNGPVRDRLSLTHAAVLVESPAVDSK